MQLKNDMQNNQNSEKNEEIIYDGLDMKNEELVNETLDNQNEELSKEEELKRASLEQLQIWLQNWTVCKKRLIVMLSTGLTLSALGLTMTGVWGTQFIKDLIKKPELEAKYEEVLKTNEDDKIKEVEDEMELSNPMYSGTTSLVGLCVAGVGGLVAAEFSGDLKASKQNLKDLKNEINKRKEEEGKTL